MYWCRNIWTSSIYIACILWMCWTFGHHLYIYAIYCVVMCHEITIWTIYILICCCYCFKIFFCVFNSFFLWGWLHRNIIFNLGEMNFSVSSPRPTEKYFFLCVYFFFLCGLTHKKISFNLGENNFSMRVRPTEKLFLTETHRKIWFFCHYISVRIFLMVHRQKNIFLMVFAFFCAFSHTQKKARFQ